MTDDDLTKILERIDSVTKVATALGKRVDAFDKKPRPKPKADETTVFGPQNKMKSKGLPAPPTSPPAGERAIADDDNDGDIISDLHEIEMLESELRRRKAAVAADMRRAEMPTPEEGHQLAEAQARADSVYNAFALRAPPPRPYETVPAYRKRLMQGLKHYSDECKNVDFAGVVDGHALDMFEKQIYADAAAAADAGVHIPAGHERKVVKKDPMTGRAIVEFRRSDGGTFIRDMTRPPMYVKHIRSAEEIRLGHVLAREGF